jgi:ribosomal protein L14E/L6E/L27E
MEGIALGQIVHSKAGRDKNKYFIVVGVIDDDYVLVADGQLRKINSPKKKKIKHLVFHDKYDGNIQKMLKENERISDADLKRSLQFMGLLHNKEV